MDLTRHAEVRMQQRGIPPLVVDLLLRFGRTEHRGGAEIRFFDKKGRKQVESYTGCLMRGEQWLNTYLVIGEEGQAITVAHRYQRIKKK